MSHPEPNLYPTQSAADRLRSLEALAAVAEQLARVRETLDVYIERLGCAAEARIGTDPQAPSEEDEL